MAPNKNVTREQKKTTSHAFTSRTRSKVGPVKAEGNADESVAVLSLLNPFNAHGHRLRIRPEGGGGTFREGSSLQR